MGCRQREERRSLYEPDFGPFDWKEKKRDGIMRWKGGGEGGARSTIHSLNKCSDRSAFSYSPPLLQIYQFPLLLALHFPPPLPSSFISLSNRSE